MVWGRRCAVVLIKKSVPNFWAITSTGPPFIITFITKPRANSNTLLSRAGFLLKFNNPTGLETLPASRCEIAFSHWRCIRHRKNPGAANPPVSQLPLMKSWNIPISQFRAAYWCLFRSHTLTLGSNLVSLFLSFCSSLIALFISFSFVPVCVRGFTRFPTMSWLLGVMFSSYNENHLLGPI